MFKGIENLKEISGIYMVVNLLNGHKYIGQSKNIKLRFMSHHCTDYINSNNCCYNTKFYQALRKYGLDNFAIIILEECKEQYLNEREIFYIKYYDTFKNGYNSTSGGQNWSENVHSTEAEHKRAITREKNKSLQSENHPRAKLTNEEVYKIRARYINGETCESIYKDYQNKYNSLAVFKRIILGYTYKTVGNIPDKSTIRYTNSKFNTAQIKTIRDMYDSGQYSQSAIARQFDVSPSAIRNIIIGKTYKQVPQ